MATNVEMFEFANEQPDGVDLPDKAPDTYKNQFILENFLHKNGCNVTLDWGNSNMTFIVLIESKRHIVGLSAIAKHKKKIHICLMFVVKKMRSKGLGTNMLTYIASLYPCEKITLSVQFDNTDVLNFYMNKGFATITSIDAQKKIIVLTLNNMKLLSAIPLPADHARKL